MAFDKSNWSVSGAHFNSNIPREHYYVSSDDAIAAINTSGYFNDLSDEVSVGDTILVKDSAGVMTRVYVASNSAGVVDVTDGDTLSATDSD